MLRFFRKLRQKFLEEGHFRKYFWYAIGEVFLVVIGILIALQINNWNQERLNHVKSIDYHQRIIADLDVIVEYTDFDAKLATDVYNSIIESIKIMETGILTDSSKQILDFMLDVIFQFSTTNYEFTTYEEMKSSGNLGLIYSSELRSDIARFLDYNVMVSDILSKMANQVSNTAFIDPYLRVTHTDFTTAVGVDYNFDDFKTDPLIINTFSRYALHWKTKAVLSERVSDIATELKISVENELEELAD